MRVLLNKFRVFSRVCGRSIVSMPSHPPLYNYTSGDHGMRFNNKNASSKSPHCDEEQQQAPQKQQKKNKKQQQQQQKQQQQNQYNQYQYKWGDEQHEHAQTGTDNGVLASISLIALLPAAVMLTGLIYREYFKRPDLWKDRPFTLLHQPDLHKKDGDDDV